MSKSHNPLMRVSNFDGVWSIQKRALRMSIIKIPSGGLCIYSPVSGTSESLKTSIDAIGKVTHLLAPNHYHNKGLGEYVEAFSDAQLCCTDAAKPRLEKQTGMQFDSLTQLETLLGDRIQLLLPDGLKTGEVWLEITHGAECAWIVTDAFCGPKGLRNHIADRPELLGTFPKFGIKDHKQYCKWVRNQIGEVPPSVIIPCHGSLVMGEKTAPEALQLVENLA